MTDTKLERLKMCAEAGMTAGQAAFVMGVDRHVIYTMVAKHGIRIRKGTPGKSLKDDVPEPPRVKCPTYLPRDVARAVAEAGTMIEADVVASNFLNR